VAGHRRKDRAPQPDASSWRHRKVQIRDLVLSADRRGAMQRVRFNVELTVGENPGRPVADDIANVVSYADIVDGVRAVLARRPDSRAETLAEEVAAMALADRRVMRARIAVDILDAGPDTGAVGVELVRVRDARPREDAYTNPASPWVVKLGGSLSRSPRLAQWLGAVAACSVPVAVVPGGGAFADQVRESQAQWGFGEAAAHHMALLAMDQMGRMFAALEPALRMCSAIEDFRAASANGSAAVWLPSAMALGQDGIEESWDVTSDSLAAWLAGRLGARGLLLVKSAEPPTEDSEAADLARYGLVDREFARSLAESGVAAWCVGPDDAHRTIGALAGKPVRVPGCRILAAPQDCPRR